ncbi:MAG TPA: BCCT family transporter [Pseudomonadales bacterium]|nr:BCCT family transporter [Pseudomonadales bacterium]
MPSILLTAAAGLLLVLVPEATAAFVEGAMATITGRFGWLFVLTGAVAFVFALWLAFGRYGHVKLGRPDEGPEYSELSWAAMMFSAGIGVGLVSWAFVEPIYYFVTPPMHIEPYSNMAAEWAHMYAQFHWGFVPWALYAVPTVPIAYALYVRDTPFLRISVASEGVLRTPARRRLEPLIDTLVIVGMIGGAGTSLGLGVPLVAAFLGKLTGIDDGFGLRLAVLAFWTLLFGTSVYQGLKAGIRRLADINIVLACGVLLFVLLAGPTVFLLTLSANSFGLMIDNFVRMSFWLDPIEHGGFPDTWTLFYWAWWIAYAPLMALFFGRISRGRTIRRTVLGIMTWGPLGCLSFMAVCGGYALHLELTGQLPVADILAEHGNARAVAEIIAAMPAGTLMTAVFTVLSFIFLATTLDSVAYVLASISTRDLPGDREPARATRLVWAFALAFIAVGLLVVDALGTVQAVSVITALPLIPVLAGLACSLLVWLDEDFGDRVRQPILALSTDADGTRQVVEEAAPGRSDGP